jgi:hypothetical protein
MEQKLSDLIKETIQGISEKSTQLEKPVNGCKQRSMLNVLKKLFIHVYWLSDLKQDHIK